MPPLLNPYHGIFLHLLLIGFPFRFGLLPTGWGRGWLFPESFLADKCSIFLGLSEFDAVSTATAICGELEQFAIRDFGVRFIFHYQLAWVVWFTMRISNECAIAFHKILLGTSLTCLVCYAWLQNSAALHNSLLPDTLRFDELMNQRFFNTFLVCHVLAALLSFWVIANYPKVELDSVKWSIPGNAVFTGGVVNLYVAVAAGQAVLKSGGIQNYFKQPVTPIVHLCFALSAIHTFIHAVILFRIRTFLNRRQLQIICLYKAIVNLVLPYFWLPEKNQELMSVDNRITVIMRGSLMVFYLFGFLMAGQAEGFSQILTSGKGE